MACLPLTFSTSSPFVTQPPWLQRNFCPQKQCSKVPLALAEAKCLIGLLLVSTTLLFWLLSPGPRCEGYAHTGACAEILSSSLRDSWGVGNEWESLDARTGVLSLQHAPLAVSVSCFALTRMLPSFLCPGRYAPGGGLSVQVRYNCIEARLQHMLPPPCCPFHSKSGRLNPLLVESPNPGQMRRHAHDWPLHFLSPKKHWLHHTDARLHVKII